MSTEARDGGAAPSLIDALPVWFSIGALGFGGPAGQIALMNRELVERRGWIDASRFLQGLNVCMLLPGPEAMQLATYVGWRLHGVAGGFAAGLLFVLPGAVAVGALAALYVAAGDAPLVAGAFLGVRAAVVALVLEALMRTGRRALPSRAARIVAGAAFVALFVFDTPFPVVIVAAALAGVAGSGRGWFPTPARAQTVAERPQRAGPALVAALVCLALWLGPLAWLLAVAPQSVFAQEAALFSKLAVVSFGGAYAVLAYVAQQAVETFGWLTAGEMADGLGLAETTPGPLVLVLQFVGFLAAAKAPGALSPMAAGVIGGCVALWTTFLPCFAWIFLVGPHVEALGRSARASSALGAVTAAVAGVILNLSVWFAIHVAFREVGRVRHGPFDLVVPEWGSIDIFSTVLAATAAIVVFRWKPGMGPLLGLAAAAGVARTLAGG